MVYFSSLSLKIWTTLLVFLNIQLVALNLHCIHEVYLNIIPLLNFNVFVAHPEEWIFNVLTMIYFMFIHNTKNISYKKIDYLVSRLFLITFLTFEAIIWTSIAFSWRLSVQEALSHRRFTYSHRLKTVGFIFFQLSSI